MAKENIIQECRLKNIDETGYYFIEEIKQSELISKKHKNVCKILNYIEHLLILAFIATGCVSISGFPSLVGIPAGIASFLKGIKICVIKAAIKMYKSIIKKKKKKYDKIVLLAKTKLNTIEVLISNALIDSYIVS